MTLLIPGMLLIGWASNEIILYSGLLLYSIGKPIIFLIISIITGAGTVVSCFNVLASRFGMRELVVKSYNFV